MSEYWLQIIFKSNERPWRNNRYDHYPKEVNKQEALEWATYMQEHMPNYQITLYEDGKVLEYDKTPRSSSASSTR